ncbi:MAG TPA: hypothetical protein VL986_09025 [Terracidiphilus sp.]|nr:hypothetical protein [Terracidiphilus sp.]
MNSWFKVTKKDWAVMDDFETIWLENGGPVDAALFGKRNQRERTNDFYFTPGVAQLAPALLQQYGATPCEKPDFSKPSLFGIALLVGDQSIVEPPSATFQRNVRNDLKRPGEA